MDFSSPLVIVFLLVIVVSSPTCYAQLQDRLSSNDTGITGNQTLVSPGKVFEFGFYNPPGDDDRYYLGIWYYNITPKAVVWVANRDRHFANSSGTIAVREDGKLVVRGSDENVWWSSDISLRVPEPTIALIRDDGNLIVTESDDGRIPTWESFNNPTDTFLPGQMLTFNRSNGNKTTITSWKSETDPSPGNYSLSLDPRGILQMVTVDTSRNNSVLWRSGVWTNTGYFNGISRLRPLGLFGFSLQIEENNKLVFKFRSQNPNSTMRFVLRPNGTEMAYAYVGGEWVSNWSQPGKPCDFYNKCGNNAVCQEFNNDNRCVCLDGFDPRLEEEWKLGNWSGGCVRRTELECDRDDRNVTFVRLKNMKLPDFGNQSLISDQDCSSLCLNNCSCTAYATLEIQGCYTWGGDLVDILRFTDGKSGDGLFLKLPAADVVQPPPPSTSGDKPGGEDRRRLVAIIVPIVVGLTLLACLVLCWKYKSKPQDKGKSSNIPSEQRLHTSGEGTEYNSSNLTYGPDSVQADGSAPELPMFSFEAIQLATDNFSEANTLGRGGFGKVYKGILPGGEEVAVKRLSRNSCQGQEEFKNEMILIAKLQHKNLVRLVGCCVQGDEKILIYEYMPNKSLDAFIFDSAMQSQLDWRKRFSIIEGIARGLVYLHQDSRPRIVHRDLKASNILLDDQMDPKISDFGMARIFGYNQNRDSTNHPVGTFGYMSPEYAMEGIFSEKSDVYSFGVLLLEIISGQKNNRFRSDDFSNLLGYAWELWSGNRTIELVEPSLRSSPFMHEILRCVHIALLCVQDRPNERPSSWSVVLLLGSDTKIQFMPKMPTFASAGGSYAEDITGFNTKDNYTVNDVTITVLTAR